MPIRITRKPVTPVIEDGALSPRVHTQEKSAAPVKVQSKADVAAFWKDMPAPGQKPVICAFCKKPYIKPCTEGQHVACQNFLHLSGKAKVLTL